MKKLVLAAGIAAAMSTAAVAEEKKIATDPFAATQDMDFGLALAIAGGLGLVIALVSADDT